MNSVEEGDIILASLPQADGQTKLRPALVVCQIPPFDDILLCGISSQLRHAVSGLDVIVDDNHPDFLQSGLTVASLIRVAFLTVKPSSTIAGAIGRISMNTRQQVLKNLSDYLIKRGKFEE